MGIEIVIPTFINPHMFFIVETKNFLIRRTIHKQMRKNDEKRKLIKPKLNYQQKEQPLYLAQVENMWVRVQIDLDVYKANKDFLLSNEYPCWLVDFGIIRIVNGFYELPEDIKQCPKLAKQASLHNVVNCSLIMQDMGLEIKKLFRKVLYPVPGVTKVCLELINSADKLLFYIEDEDEHLFYGDIVCQKGEQRLSITEELIQMRLMAFDRIMFKQIPYREDCRLTYLGNKSIWKRPVNYGNNIDRSEKIYEEEISEFYFEYFRRQDFNRIILRIIEVLDDW